MSIIEQEIIKRISAETMCDEARSQRDALFIERDAANLRAEQAEAKLARAVTLLRAIKQDDNVPAYIRSIVSSTLTELSAPAGESARPEKSEAEIDAEVAKGLAHLDRLGLTRAAPAEPIGGGATDARKLDPDMLRKTANAVYYAKSPEETFTLAATLAFAVPKLLDALASPSPDPREAKIAELPWRCFHCDEVFADQKAAQEHFGIDEMTSCAGCIEKVNGGEIGLLRRVRDLEQQLIPYLSESDAVSNYVAGKMTAHAQALIREEERGYDKGVQEAKAEYAAACAKAATALEPADQQLILLERISALYENDPVERLALVSTVILRDTCMLLRNAAAVHRELQAIGVRG